MALSRHEGDLQVTGNFVSKTMSLPAGCVEADDIEANAGIEASKLQHRHQPTFAQPNTAAADETRMVHVVYGTTGSIIAFKAGSIAKAVGDAITTVDLKVNGASVLSAVITLDNANTNRVAESGTVLTPALVVGDVIEVVVDGTIGTGTLPTGVFASVVINEDAQ